MQADKTKLKAYLVSAGAAALAPGAADAIVIGYDLNLTASDNSSTGAPDADQINIDLGSALTGNLLASVESRGGAGFGELILRPLDFYTSQICLPKLPCADIPLISSPSASGIGVGVRGAVLEGTEIIDGVDNSGKFPIPFFNSSTLLPGFGLLAFNLDAGNNGGNNGWLRYSLNGVSISVSELAIETELGVAITAGDRGTGTGTIPVPEPASLALMLTGLAGLGAMRRRRKLAA